MSHFVLDGIFVVVGILIVVLCAKRGFFKTLMGFLRLLLAIAAAYLFGGKVAAFLAEKFMAALLQHINFAEAIIGEIGMNPVKKDLQLVQID